jgi:ADP-ribose pyrophosphatase YjhB (NUDIX family)
MIKNNTDKKPGAGFGVMILKGKKVLLGHRNEDPQKASSLLHGEGSWTMPGGKLHFQEKLKEGAIREVFEETGMKVKNLEAISISNDIVSDAHFVTIGFLTEEFEREPKVMEPEEITEWKWFDLTALPSLLYFPSEKIIKNYLAGKIYQDK